MAYHAKVGLRGAVCIQQERVDCLVASFEKSTFPTTVSLRCLGLRLRLINIIAEQIITYYY
jgi:hypothetical protein